LKLDRYEQSLLNSWEEIFKKGQLTLWILLALKESPKHMVQIKDFIERLTYGTLTADDQSMYRALRRYHDAELVSYTNEPGKSAGPERKMYQLTDIGRNVLGAFVTRNIRGVFYQQEVKALIGDIT
jgi:PadR family transcriptional regulator PadR